jgi:hypothetical protein
MYSVSGSFNTGGSLEGIREWALRTLHELPDELNTRFFSAKNVDYLQNRIVRDVKDLSGFTVGRQSDEALAIIMIGIYERFRGARTVDVTILNNAVLRVCVEQCITGINAYSAYYRDATTQRVPLPRGINPSIKGENPLPGFLPMGR